MKWWPYAALCAWTALSGLTLSIGIKSGRLLLIIAGGTGSLLIAGIILWPEFRRRSK